MQKQDLVSVTDLLRSLYGDRFPELTAGMADLWQDAMQHLDVDTVRQGVRRWAKHHTMKAPSLDELLEQVEYIREDAKRRAAAVRPDIGKTTADILEDAAMAQENNPARSAADRRFGRLMVTLALRHLDSWTDSKGVTHPPLTYDQMAQQCRRWAGHYEANAPKLAADLIRTAIDYAHFAAQLQDAAAD